MKYLVALLLVACGESAGPSPVAVTFDAVECIPAWDSTIIVGNSVIYKNECGDSARVVIVPPPPPPPKPRG